MTRLILLLLLLGGTAIAQTPPPAGDPRVRTIAYDAGQVFRLRVATGYQSTILFDPEEQVESVGVGDSDAWQVTLNGRGDALFLKPLRANSATNMTVITDARVYSFDLSSAHGPGGDTPFTVRFVHANTPVVEAQAPSTPQPAGRYRVRGSQTLRPVSISDDGVRTYIEWGAQQAIPAVFAQDEGGDLVLVEGHVRSGLYVIDAVHQRLLFRLDGQTARATRNRTRRRE